MNKLQLHRAPRASIFVPLVVVWHLCACASQRVDGAQDAASKKFLRYEIVATHPHDTAAFTQGLALLGRELVESRGHYGASAVTIGDAATGAARQRHDLDRAHFGEGVAVAGREIVQLTWLSGLAFVYDAGLRKTGEHRYSGEGWGLAFDGKDWLMSDGSHRITRRRTGDFAVVGEIRVTDAGRPLSQLNELEFAQGRLYSNVWHADRVAVIDPANGSVEAWLDFAPLRRGFPRPPGWNEAEHVLNGIAFDPSSGHFYVTGKCWPVLYEVRVLR